MLDDPFVYIRNKEKADEVIEVAITKYLGSNPTIYNNTGLNVDECEQVTLMAFERLKRSKVVFKNFEDANLEQIRLSDDLNFKTSFEIYKDANYNQVEKS